MRASPRFFLVKQAFFSHLTTLSQLQNPDQPNRWPHHPIPTTDDTWHAAKPYRSSWFFSMSQIWIFWRLMNLENIKITPDFVFFSRYYQISLKKIIFYANKSRINIIDLKYGDNFSYEKLRLLWNHHDKKNLKMISQSYKNKFRYLNICSISSVNKE